MHRWKLSALAAAALVSVSLTAGNAWALALGRLSIQSALGEPLRAEVELPQITAAEAESLQATIASPAVFRAQGMQYTATASQFQVVLQRRPDGSAMLRLSSAQPVTEPFVDLVIDASWAAGQVVRSYTLLLDPPAARQTPAATLAPQVGAAAAVPPTTAPARNAPVPAPAAARAPAPAAAARAPAQPAAVTVRSGDTASRIAQANRPAGVSLDQMLVAMLRANPQAFISGNVNRMRAGVVLEMPDQAAAQATSIPEARQIVAAQSQDFNRYRRQLAAAAPPAPMAAAQRSASGNVEAQVEDRKPTTAAPDKLTLSKGALAADERLAQEKQAQSQSERLAELSRNLIELQNVATGAAAPGAAAPAGTPAAGVPAAGIPATGVPAADAPAAGAAVTATAPATPAADAAATAAPAVGDGAVPAAPEAATPAPEAGEPAAAAPAAAAPAAAAEPAAPSSSDTLRDNPLLPLAGAGLLALLLGLVGYRHVQRRRAQNGASDTLLHNDSFFDLGQGQRGDAAHTQFGGATAYSHSQLDTGGEVDPVAEADVYLAYGRDLQAEEILKEALRTQPERLALHLKLADIHAKRQDRKAFEAVAQTVFALTQGKGAEWLQLAEHGRALDAANPLYQAAHDALPGGSAITPAGAPHLDSRAAAQASVAAALGGLAAAAATKAAAAPPSDQEPGLEPELPPIPVAAPATATPADEARPPAPGVIDFEPTEPVWKQPASAAADALADLPVVPVPATQDKATTAPTVPAGPVASDTLPDLEFTLDSEAQAPQAREQAAAHDTPALDLPGSAAPPAELPSAELPDTDATAPAAAAPAPALGAAAAPAAAPAFDFLEFDLGNLSLDLGPKAPADALSQSSQAAAEDPLATKLALAQEFAAIGDSEGARTLIEEVIEEAEGELKERAQRLLSEID